MTAGLIRLPGRRVGVMVLVLLLVTACRADDDPRAELRSAVEATAAGPFTFAISPRADRAALEELGGDVVASAAFLDGAGLSGARDPDGRLHVAFHLGGDAPLLEVIAEADGDGLLLRTGLGEMLGLEGRDPGEALDPALDDLEVEDAGREALAVSFAGGWVALTDVGDLGQLLDATTGEGATTEPTQPARLSLDDVTVTAARDVGDVRRLDVQVRPEALLAPFGLDAGEDPVPGTVDLRDGRIVEARLRLSSDTLGGGASSGGEEGSEREGGVVELVLRIASAGDAASVVERPDAGASLSAEELFRLVEQLQAATGPPAP